MSFALVTTVHPNGETGIGPHALCFPFGITRPCSMLLISRGNSGTAVNIRRTGKCALNYVEYDREQLHAIASLGYPGMALVDKQKANPFTMVSSPNAERAADTKRPSIIAEAFQVFECSWNQDFDFGGFAPAGDGSSAKSFCADDRRYFHARRHQRRRRGR